MTDRFDDCICGVCAKNTGGLGYAPSARYGQPAHPILWICGDDECIQIARESYHMKPDHFSRIESLAAQEGRVAAEAFCDEIGKYDFRELTIDEACEFSRRLIAGYREALKVKLRDEAPF